MQDKLDRLHFMDAMRATLMILGVVLHSASVFKPDQSWVIYSNHTDQSMGYLVNFITTFRMPAFFVVSGYFCYLTLSKYKVKKFLSVRLKRIIVPLVFTLLTLNLLQSVFLEVTGWRPPLADYIQKGGYLAHLWFLVNLVVYFIVASVMAIILRPVANTVKNLTARLFDNIPIVLIIFGMPLFSIIIMGSAKTGFPLYTDVLGFFNIQSILIHAPFFAFGIAIALHKDTLRQFSTINPLICIAIIVASVFLTRLVSGPGSIMLEVASIYLDGLTQWASILICFYVFYTLFNKESQIGRLLSESSYSIYLLHHILVIVLGALLIHLDISAILGTIILILMVTAITFVIHTSVISKNKLLLFLFNGK